MNPLLTADLATAHRDDLLRTAEALRRSRPATGGRSDRPELGLAALADRLRSSARPLLAATTRRRATHEVACCV